MGKESPEVAPEDRFALVGTNLARHPLREVLAPTVGDMAGHLCARLALVRLLLKEKRTKDLFATLDTYTKMPSKISRFVEGCDLLARGLGLRNRGQIWTVGNVRRATGDGFAVDRALANEEIIGVLQENIWQDFIEWSSAWRDIIKSQEVIDAALAFVRDQLELPWPWVAFDIVETYRIAILGHAFGHSELGAAVTLRDLSPIAPSISQAFATIPGEPLNKAVGRFRNEFEEMLNRLSSEAEASPPLGVKPREDVTERYVDWFYRSKVCRESINSIARSADDSGYDRARRHVRQGIARAEYLLGLTQHVFAPVPTGK